MKIVFSKQFITERKDLWVQAKAAVTTMHVVEQKDSPGRQDNFSFRSTSFLFHIIMMIINL